MNTNIKKILKIAAIVLLSILTILVVFTLSLQLKPVQNFLSQKAVDYLSKELHTTIKLKSIYFKPFKSLLLEDLEIYDRSGKKIFNSGTVVAKINLAEYWDRKKITIQSLSLERTQIAVEKFKDSSNISFLIDYFSAPQKTPSTSKQKLQIDLQAINLSHVDFRFIDHTKPHYQKVIDFSDLHLSGFSAQLNQIKMDSTGYAAHFKNFSLREKKGLQIKQLTGDLSFSSKKIEAKNFLVETNRSIFKNYVRLDYNSLDDFDDFINKVHVEIRSKNSRIHSEDIAFFSSDMHQVKFDAQVKNLWLSGKVSRFSGKNADIQVGKNSQIAGDIDIIGLPDIDQTQFILPKIKISSDYADLNKIIPELGNMKKFKLPEFIQKFGKIHYEGALKGKYNDFSIVGNTTVKQGVITTNSSLKITDDILYSGRYASKKFLIAEVVPIENLKSTGFDLTLSGKNFDFESMQLQAKGTLQQFHFKHHDYQQILLDASLLHQHITANGKISDPAAQLTFQTNINLHDSTSVYDLSTQIEYADLKTMNLLNTEKFVLQNTQIHTNLMGSEINNIIGKLESDSISFTTNEGHYVVNKVYFEAAGNEINRTISLQSDVATLDLNGQLDLNTIVPYFRSLAMQYAPAIGFQKQHYKSQRFDVHLAIRSFKPIASFFRKDLTLDSGATFRAKFDSDNHAATFNFYAPIFRYNGIKFSNVIVDQNANENALALITSVGQVNITDSTYVKNINIANILANDSLKFNVKMSEIDAKNNLDLNGVILFAHEKPAVVRFYPSRILINEDSWSVNHEALLKISKGKWYFDNLILNHEHQKVNINGILSDDQSDKMNLKFEDFNLTSLNGITNPLGIHHMGQLNGNIELNSIFKSPYFLADIHTSPITYNGVNIGKLALNATYEPENQLIQLNTKIEDTDKLIQLEGTYDLGKEKNKLDLEGKVQNADAILAQPFLADLVSQLNGKVSGNVKITGDILQPKFNGNGTIENTHLTVNYLKTPYTIKNGKFNLISNGIFLNNLIVHDAKDNQASINGLVDLNKLSDPMIDIQASAKNFMLLNTTAKDNNLYYGSAFGTGVFKFKGLTSAININIVVNSEDHTELTIPMNTVSEISDSDFIYFIEKDTLSNRKTVQKNRLLKGMSMNMDMTINPNAKINIESTLGKLSGTGNGLINLKISSLGDFEMFGDYVVNNGQFNFKAQDYINKIFDLKEGGTIRWAGNPSEATINLNAYYQVRTNLSPLYNAAGREGNTERILAQSEMFLKGKLSQPDVTFDINFPQNPGIKDELQSYFSDANNVNQQALSLIIRRSFTPTSQSDFGREINNTLLSAGTEVAFNQLNNIIAQSLNVNFFDLNIRSLNDASASLRLFNDRLVLTGGITDNRNAALNDLTVFSNRVSTDAEALYYLRKDGRLVLRASNRLNTRNFLLSPTDGEYISAFGLLYRKDFDSVSELVKSLFFLDNKPRNNGPKKTISAKDSK